MVLRLMAQPEFLFIRIPASYLKCAAVKDWVFPEGMRKRTNNAIMTMRRPVIILSKKSVFLWIFLLVSFFRYWLTLYRKRKCWQYLRSFSWERQRKICVPSSCINTSEKWKTSSNKNPCLWRAVRSSSPSYQGKTRSTFMIFLYLDYEQYLSISKSWRNWSRNSRDFLFMAAGPDAD